ncbi:hypothetical protein Tco_1248547 [Tanacetum coccineum]
MVERRIVWELELMTWLDQGLRQEYIEDLGWECREHKCAKSTKKVHCVREYELALLRIRFKVYLVKVYAYEERKEWAYVIMRLFRKKMFGVYVEEMKSLVGIREAFGGNTCSLDSIWEKTEQDYNSTIRLSRFGIQCVETASQKLVTASGS